jgi:hypothetical protein
MYLQISMEGYADPTFFCKNHQNSKRIKAKSYHMMLANKIVEVVIGPLDIKTDSIFLVMPSGSLQPLHRFVYPDAITRIIKVPLFTAQDFFINTDAVLFTLAGSNMEHVWATIEEDDVFYSDEEDQHDEDQEDQEEPAGEQEKDKQSDDTNESDRMDKRPKSAIDIEVEKKKIKIHNEPTTTLTDIDIEML